MSKTLARDCDGMELKRHDCVAMPSRRTAVVLNRGEAYGRLLLKDIEGIVVDLPANIVRKVASA